MSENGDVEYGQDFKKRFKQMKTRDTDIQSTDISHHHVPIPYADKKIENIQLKNSVVNVAPRD